MTFWNILLLLLGILSLCATICLMALGSLWLSSTNGAITVLIWWFISRSGHHKDDD